MRTVIARGVRYRWWLVGVGIFVAAVAALLSSFVGPPAVQCQVRAIECLMPRELEGEGPGLLAICLTFTNRSHRTVHLLGRQFSLRAGWRSYQPKVEPPTGKPRTYVELRQPTVRQLTSRTLPPGGSTDGWLVFEGLVDDIRKPVEASSQFRALRPILVQRDGLRTARYGLTAAADQALNLRARPTALDPEFAVVEVPFGVNLLNLAPWMAKYQTVAGSAPRATILLLSGPHAHLDSPARLALVLSPPPGGAPREVVVTQQGDPANQALGIRLSILGSENEAVIHLEGQRPDGRQRLARALKAADVPTRLAAVGALGGEQPAWAELCHVLVSDPDAAVRCAAATQFTRKRLDDERYRPALAAAVGKGLLDPDPNVRTLCCLAVMTHGLAPECRASIRALLTGGSPDELVVRLAGELNDGELVPTLINLLHDRNVADAAADVLGKLGDRRAEPALRALLTRERAGQTGAIWAIGRLGTRQDIPTLAAIYHHASRSGSVRRACVEACGRLGGPAAWDLVYEALSDQTDTSAASKAATEIARFNDPRAVPLLLKAGQARDNLLNQSALLGLIGITGPAADAALLTLVGTTDRAAIRRRLGTNEH